MGNQRRPISIDQRRQLRAFSQSLRPKPSQKRCIEWFQATFNQRISQTTVSESLSDQYQSLDSSLTLVKDTQKLQKSHWPELEEVLIEWQRMVESQGGVTSQDLLRSKAKEIWQRLPSYANQPSPDFSNGWLYRFQKRHNIRQHTLHGEAGSVPAIAETTMHQIRALASDYGSDDIYNMDETALYWRKSISKGLSTSTMSGIKMDKSRISLAFCCNASGKDRLPIWLIGKAKTPRALKGLNLSTMGVVWRHNQKAWMTALIMKEWLQSFYQHISVTRQVVLLMDNCSAHIAAVNMHSPPPHITITWLPPNATSQFQPLDQGIISSFKAYYKRQWLEYMMDCFVQNINPIKSMTLHLAIRWSVRAWHHDLKDLTIKNCFVKSTVLDPGQAMEEAALPNLEPLYLQAQQAGRIKDSMTIVNFLNPQEEIENVDMPVAISDDLLENIISDHITGENEMEEEEFTPSQPVPSLSDALTALSTVIEFVESDKDMLPSHLRQLERMEKDLQALKVSRQSQGTLDRWIG
jgi:hypothetical protein